MSDYIIEPIDTDPDELLSAAIDYIQSRYPNWEPSEAQLDFMLMRMWSLQQSQIADMSTRVLRAIFRYFGSTIVQIQPLDGSNAEALTTWFVTDPNPTNPYIIPQDTQVGIRDPVTNDLIFFNVADQDYEVPLGASFLAGVKIRSQDEGQSQNELSGPLEIVEQLDWVQSAQTTTESSGGSDPETDDDYVDRLAANFGLLSPRPVLASDYAIMARNVSGVFRSIGRDNFIPGNNEIQRLSHTGTGGTFKVTFGAESSADIPWNANIDQFGDALANMTAFQAGDFVLTGGPFPAQTFIEYTGNLHATNQPQMTIDPTNLTGGSGHTEITTQVSTADQNNVEDAVTVGAVDVSGNTLVAGKRTELLTYLNSLRIQNFEVYEADPAYSTVDVTATLVPLPGFEANDVIGPATDALGFYLDPSSWGVPQSPEPNTQAWENKTAVRSQELYTILNNVQGVDYVSALSFGLNGGAQSGADKNLTGLFPLTRPGVINLTV